MNLNTLSWLAGASLQGFRGWNPDLTEDRAREIAHHAREWVGISVALDPIPNTCLIDIEGKRCQMDRAFYFNEGFQFAEGLNHAGPLLLLPNWIEQHRFDATQSVLDAALFYMENGKPYLIAGRESSLAVFLPPKWTEALQNCTMARIAASDILFSHGLFEPELRLAS